MRPINGNWTCKPGNFDPLHCLETFAGVDPYGIPILEPEDAVPEWWLAYDDWRAAAKKGKLPKKPGLSAVHFFTEDYRMEPVWNNPTRVLSQIDAADILLTPDFSLYTNHPRAIQIWQTYRSRWVGAYWQNLGKRVIPTVCWSDVESHQYAFDGLPYNSVLAISTTGIWNDPETMEGFIAGYTAMCERLAPKLVLSYSERFPDQLRSLAPLKLYQPWHVAKLRAIDAAKALQHLAAPVLHVDTPAPALPEQTDEGEDA